MEALDVKDMIGYKAASQKMKTNTIDKLIGVKSPKFENLPPITKKSTTVEDFKLMKDIHKNVSPIDVQDLPKDSDKEIVSKEERAEKAFAFLESNYSHPMDAVVPGYSKAGGWGNRTLAKLGVGFAKRKVARAKRHLVVNTAMNEGSKIASSLNPDLDPNVIHAGAGLAGLAANTAGDKGVKWMERRAKLKKLKK